MNGNTGGDSRRRRGELRSAVLTLGRLLGWGRCEVIVFAEEVTGRSWQHCGCADFERVIEEYWAIGRVIQEQRARRESKGDHHAVVR